MTEETLYAAMFVAGQQQGSRTPVRCRWPDEKTLHTLEPVRVGPAERAGFAIVRFFRDPDGGQHLGVTDLGFVAPGNDGVLTPSVEA
jgi:hypothetical protein